MPPIPASQCALHSATLAAQWWAVPSVLLPSDACGGRPLHTVTQGAVPMLPVSPPLHGIVGVQDPDETPSIRLQQVEGLEEARV